MSKVFTFTNAKGGCGKTTVALNLAIYFAAAFGPSLIPIQTQTVSPLRAFPCAYEVAALSPSSHCPLPLTMMPNPTILRGIPSAKAIEPDCYVNGNAPLHCSSHNVLPSALSAPEPDSAPHSVLRPTGDLHPTHRNKNAPP